jgi:hypothetical protein
MSKRSLTWLRQYTNVEDLLDDGIENNSDLKSFATHGQPSDELPVAERAQVPLQASHIDTPRSAPPERDFTLAGIGLLIMGCGLGLVLYPVDLVVYHQGAKYAYRGLLEHVTTGRSQIYGSVGIVLGAALLIYALKKARK